ncbi:MAG: S41 family peptidase [Pyrinomonadaceae bacterium]
MKFKKAICLAGLACIFSTQTGVAQRDTRFSQLPPSSDPFTLAQGRSFSASGRDRAGSGNSRKRTITSDVEEALKLVIRNHVTGKRLDRGALAGSAITGMLHTLDPHSNYYDPDEFQQLLGEHESEYTGTGSSIAGFERDGKLDTYIVSTFSGSPSAAAGLRFGDRILAVDGRRVSGETPDLVRDLMRGPRGTIVRLTIERADGRTVETVEMKRERVHEPAVPKGFLLHGSVGYIDLTNGFSNVTFREFQIALDDLKRQGLRSLVLDLRGNGGGILDQAIKVAEKFLPAGTTVLTQRGRGPADTRTWKAAKGAHESMPLVLIVDEDSASASEVLAGALQDNDRALVVGSKTFGKGLVQSVLNLPEGAGLTLTAARYYTPAGRSIQRDYAATGLYDYFHHRTAAEIDKPVYAARTITNRVMYGGDGITPDELADQDRHTPGRSALLDAIFHFSRDLAGGRLAMNAPTTLTPVQHLRQRIVLNGSIVDEQLVTDFRRFIGGNEAPPSIQAASTSEKAFSRRMLEYYLSLAAFGTDLARKVRIESDPVVQKAVDALPRSAELAAEAQRARNSSARKKKSSPSLILNEQSRNRRN